MIGRKTREAPRKQQKGSRIFALAEELLKERNIEDAIQCYRAAERAGYDPDACAGARWICHMLLGDFESAWRESDAIEERGNPDPNRFWNGEPLEGKRVLVRCLHGLGDTLQYIRYAPQIRKTARTLIIEAQPALKTLLSEAGVADEVITWGDPEPVWDLQVEIVELPRIFRTTIQTIPTAVPYLQVPAAEVSRPDGGLRIGLLWRSSDFNTSRTVPFSELSKVCRIPGARFLSFQPEPGPAEIRATEARVEDFVAPECCILETARRLRTVDLLITVDTMLAHLAGALGVLTWTLLPFEADWRWMINRSDSPWYSTMRLFRQRERGDWTSVIRELQDELELLRTPGG